MPSTRLIFGCGYLGSRAAALWREEGDTVYAVTRSADRVAEFTRQGWRPLVADVLDPQSLLNLPAADSLLFAVARGRGSDVPIRRLYVEGLRNVLAALPAETARVIYISSTGVYAQDDGSWVDEASPTTAQREGGAASLEAERVLSADPRGRTSIIIRMAGLYGPGRVPRRDDLLAGKPLVDPGDGWLNLIHVDDGARIIVAAADAGLTGVMNVSDGQPVRRREYLQEMARLLGAPEPTFRPALPDEARSQRGSTSKRVGNRRLVEELGMELQIASYRDGLAAILRSE